MTSLAELRAIEAERVAAERAAVIAAREAGERARALAEQRSRDEEVARIAAAREAALAITHAREQAERAARMHVEAAQAAERERHHAALAQERLAQELQLRRAEVARKRPTWMVVVTLLAVGAGCALTWFALDRQQASDRAAADRRVAQAELTTARAEVDLAIRALDQVQLELAILDRRVERALADLEVARSAQARLAATTRLQALREEQRAIERKKAEARQAADKAKRIEKFVISEKCKRNAFDPECQVPAGKR